MSSEAIIDFYERHAREFDRARGRSLQEKGWLDRFCAQVRPQGVVLDLGCGMGEPIAQYILDRGFEVVGIDSSPTLIELARARFPVSHWLVADMRQLALKQRFDGLVAWDSFFHLHADAQRAMFTTFAAHSAPGAPLLFTTGPSAGEVLGCCFGDPLYHASLSPAEYERLLVGHDFAIESRCVDDAECGGHTVWLARYAGRSVRSAG